MLFTRAAFVSLLILSVGQIDPVQKYGMAVPSSKNYQILTLTRIETRGLSVWGTLDLDGKFMAYTLENETKKIPAGSYVVHKTKRGFRLEAVPGRSKINIEVGNYPFESLGCIFVGTKKTAEGVEGSKLALLRLGLAVHLPAVLVVT